MSKLRRKIVEDAVVLWVDDIAREWTCGLIGRYALSLSSCDCHQSDDEGQQG